MPDQESPSQLEDIFSICKEKINIQIQQLTSLENKANSNIGFAGVVFALLLAAIDKISDLPSCSQILIFIGVILLSGSMILSLLSLQIKKFGFYPDLTGLYSHYQNSLRNKFLHELIKCFAADWKENNKILEEKAKKLRYSYWLQMSSAIFLALTTISIIVF